MLTKKALLIAVAGLTLTGCSSTLRAVTHVSTWNGAKGDYLYIGYAENNDTSRVRKCGVNDDNTITCEEQEAVNKLLSAE